MDLNPFTPCYILETELSQYGLPTTEEQPDIMNGIQFCSSYIDEECGRIDGDGNGSLVFTTYVQRMLLQTRNRNLFQLPYKPLVPVSSGTVEALMVAASGQDFNCFYTGVQPNTLVNLTTGSPTAIIGASGRYGYTRQDMSIAYPDLWAMVNPLNLVTLFGGPAPWIPIDVTNIDYDYRTGEIWVPVGLQLQRYSEIIIMYNTGYDPRQMPRSIKHVCASMVKGLLPRGGATSLLNMSLGRSGANVNFFQGGILDPTLDKYLRPFKTVRAY